MDSIIPLGQKNTLAEYMILSGADNRPSMMEKDFPLIWPTIEENGVTRTKKYVELSVAEKIQADCDMKATNIILQGLPADIYSLVNHYRVTKDLWERVQLLMQGTSLTKQERECKLYDAFDKFTHIKGESLHKYYLRFTQLINDMNIFNMKMEQFQVNTKFLNSLPPEWSKFVTDVKLVKDLHTTNFYQLHAYLEQHELYANEVRFAVLVFSPGDDLIACLNKAMAFLTAIASSRFPSTNNQLRTSSNLRNQATIQDGRVTVQQVQGRQGHSYSGTGYKNNATSSGGNNPRGQARTEDLDTYDSDCDDISNAKEVLMANISNYGSDVISEVPHSETYLNDIENQSTTRFNDLILTAELERYKERVKTFEQRLNIDLSSREKMIDSQMDDMIKEKLALKEQVDSLNKRNLLNKSSK
ncbi:hypothetical protein Tco_1069249 [Tanacetum coccineum]|uniref:Integrase, catalytic region, zinc finger, CCHC-type, peptidase aspartic, catalytic n=1 Tax=Tanacetum coccineum TaxID=301880 RepID=A0ABQ5HJW4_9ASTR